MEVKGFKTICLSIPNGHQLMYMTNNEKMEAHIDNW
jgi:hypothetical protein